MSADPVSDDLWERMVPLLPPRRSRRNHNPGRLPVPDRVALAGIVCVLRRGIAWRDVPAQVVGCSEVTSWRRRRGAAGPPNGLGGDDDRPGRTAGE
ncbi:transposase [Streptomyces sp. MBT62]|nr:transposase [Streptomyces sp. MBT62]